MIMYDIKTGEIIGISRDDRAVALTKEIKGMRKIRNKMEMSLPQKSKFYKVGVDVAIIATVIGCVISLITMMITLFTPVDLEIVTIISGIVMVVGLIASVILTILREIYRRRLVKYGLSMPE